MRDEGGPSLVGDGKGVGGLQASAKDRKTGEQTNSSPPECDLPSSSGRSALPCLRQQLHLAWIF